MENRFEINLWKNVFSITREQHDKEKALNELYISRMVDIADENKRPDCVCSHPKIRFCYEVTSRETNKKLFPIGSTCIEIFKGNNEVTRQYLIYKNSELKLFVNSALEHKDKEFYEIVKETPEYKGDPKDPTENMKKFIQYRNEVLKEYDHEQKVLNFRKRRALRIIRKVYIQWKKPCDKKGRCLRSDIPFECRSKCIFRNCETCNKQCAKFEMDNECKDCRECEYKNNCCLRCNRYIQVAYDNTQYCLECYEALTYIGKWECRFKSGPCAGKTWDKISQGYCKRTIEFIKNNNNKPQYYHKNLNIIHFLQSRSGIIV
jgi:hypothetical protein